MSPPERAIITSMMDQCLSPVNKFNRSGLLQPLRRDALNTGSIHDNDDTIKTIHAFMSSIPRRHEHLPMEPKMGNCSPIKPLMTVDSPASFAQTTATRLTCDTVRYTSTIAGLSFEEYWKSTHVMRRTILLRLLTPSKGPGSGKANFILSLLSTKYAFFSGYILHKHGRGVALHSLEGLQLRVLEPPDVIHIQVTSRQAACRPEFSVSREFDNSDGRVNVPPPSSLTVRTRHSRTRLSKVHLATKQLDDRMQPQTLPSNLTVRPVFMASSHITKTSAMPSSSTLHHPPTA